MNRETNDNWKWIVACITIFIGVSTWIMDFYGWVYPCPFCRTQRTAILILGVFLLLPFHHHWTIKWFSLVTGGLGFVVAAMQHFSHIKKILAGTFEFGDSWYMHPYLLSGAAMFIISGQLMLLLGIKSSK